MSASSRGREGRDTRSAELRVDCRLPDGKYCAKCCYDTRMPLTRSDIERIIRLGYSVDEFAIKGSDSVYYLRNINGHCFFLDEETGMCRIYPWRPAGCRLYPLVYDPEQQRVTVDPDCPRKYTVPKKVIEEMAPRLIELIREIYGELPA